MAFISIIILTFIVTIISFVTSTIEAQRIILGSSLSPTRKASWSSPSGRFSFGFCPQGDGFVVGIVLEMKENSRLVWMANRDLPPVNMNATLDLTNNGIILTNQQGEETLLANTTHSAYSASMLDSGNFLLYSKNGDVVWQSFNSPTDTILGGQSLRSGFELFSSVSEIDHSTGRFHLKMQTDGNLVLYPTNTDDTPTDAYWSSGTNGMGPNLDLYLNTTIGQFQIKNDTRIFKTISFPTISPSNDNSNFSSNVIYRATLDVDGIFRLYSHVFTDQGKSNMSTVWFALDNACGVKGVCGFNSYCTFNDNQQSCMCVPGTDFIDINHRSLGCKRNYSESGCPGGKENATFYNIITMMNVKWDSNAYIKVPLPMEECSRSCLEDCDCGAALFESESCMREKLPLRYVTRDLDAKSMIFFKIGIKSLDDRNESIPISMNKPKVIRKKRMAEILVITLGFIILSCGALAISGIFIFKYQVLRYKRQMENGNLGLQSEELNLRLFSYGELRRATNGFTQELGKGSFGAVYKGSFYKGKKLVAVKRLEKLVEDGEKEFSAEMRTIGRTHHRNLVRLLGYCAQDSKRLLVYEFMSNGSLADLLFRSARRPPWDERVRIAVDVAKGILYLHEECDTPIIHCDIKPQNILMDDFWTAKISDFGLSKLLMPDQTRTFTNVRGTRGYLAPEWHKNTPISVKADIYSFGIVLLEIVCCRRSMQINESKPEQILLTNWAYKLFIDRELNKLVAGEEVDKKTFEKMVKVGLWCIQDEPALRPSMKSVVLMLEGITDIASPPCPTQTSM